MTVDEIHVLLLALLLFVLAASVLVLWWVHRWATDSGDEVKLPRHHGGTGHAGPL